MGVTGYVCISEDEQDTEMLVLGNTGPSVGRKLHKTIRFAGRSRGLLPEPSSVESNLDAATRPHLT